MGIPGEGSWFGSGEVVYVIIKGVKNVYSGQAGQSHFNKVKFFLETQLKMSQNNAVENLRAYLRTNTMHPKPDYTECVAFLRQQAEDLNLSFRIIEVPVN